MENKQGKYLARVRNFGDGMLKISINLISLGSAVIIFVADKPYPAIGLITIVIGLVLMFVGISLKEHDK